MTESFRRQLARIRDLLFPRPKLCSKKARYASCGEAIAVRRYRQLLCDETLYVYHCPAPECNGYHITRMKPPEEAMC